MQRIFGVLFIHGCISMILHKYHFYIFWPFVISFLFLPIHTQYLISDFYWGVLNLGGLFLFSALLFFFFSCKSKILLGFDDVVFYLAAVFSLAHYLMSSTSQLFFSLVAAYFFYFSGKVLRLFLSLDSVFEASFIVARLSFLYFFYLFLMWSEGGGFSGDINPNSFALHIAIVSSILLFSYHKRGSLYDLGAFFIIILFVLYSGSRGGLALITIFFFAFTLYRRDSKILGLVLGCAFFLLYLYQSESFVDFRIFEQYNMHLAGGSHDLTSGRSDGYVVAFSLLSDSFLFGVGDVNLYDHGLGYSQIHNFYIRILAEYGALVFSLALFLILTVSAKVSFSDSRYRLFCFFSIAMLTFPLLYEPNGLFGNFKITGIVWVLMGALSVSSSFRIKVDNFRQSLLK